MTVEMNMAELMSSISPMGKKNQIALAVASENAKQLLNFKLFYDNFKVNVYKHFWRKSRFPKN